MDDRLAERFAVADHRGMWVAAIWIVTGLLAAGGQLVMGDEASVLSQVAIRPEGVRSSSGEPAVVRVVAVERPETVDTVGGPEVTVPDESPSGAGDTGADTVVVPTVMAAGADPAGADPAVADPVGPEGVFAAIEDGRVVLRGRVRDEASKIGLVANVRRTLFGDVVDELEIDPYAPLPPERLALSLPGAAIFAPDSPGLLASAHASLDVAVEIIDRNPEFRLIIRGHTDDQGGVDHNFRLATERGEAVFGYLVDSGIDPSRLLLEPRGQSDPIADNSTETGRKQNRRVELVLVPR